MIEVKLLGRLSQQRTNTRKHSSGRNAAVVGCATRPEPFLGE